MDTASIKFNLKLKKLGFESLLQYHEQVLMHGRLKTPFCSSIYIGGKYMDDDYNSCLSYFIKNLPKCQAKSMNKQIEKILNERDRKREEQKRIDSGYLGIMSCGA